uniref:APC membrane recruitment protein 2 n=1 Tax=Euleptes europaea TaxID=460621 RepID=UPI002540D029|nr:APC membrane recruitment protein 2 [Euleptes europaea]
MDLPCDGGEPTAVAEPPQPSGKLNRTAFKLFRRRKSGGALPSIFGVRGGKGKRGGGGGEQAGLVRSRTHDGLAEAVLESGKKEGPDDGAPEPPPASASGKPHGFLALLRKSGGPRGERPPKGRGGLKGLFSSMRWPRRDGKPKGGERPAGPGLLLPGSLTASLECVKEEAPRSPAPAPPSPPGPQAGQAGPPPEQRDREAQEGEEPPAGRAQERHPPGPETPQDVPTTGCGDVIADPEDDAGSGGGGSERSAPGAAKPRAPKKPCQAYQGGGEEMASPEQVGDTCAPEFWDTLSQTEETSRETPGGTEGLGASGDGRRGQEGPASEEHLGQSQMPAHHADQKSREKEQAEAVPSGDEGYWDSTTPGPEEDNTNSIQKEVIPRDSYSGDALYDLYADPDESTAAVTSTDATSVTCCKPLSPVTSTCPVKTHTTSLKDSKIPISIKHFTSPQGSHGLDAGNSHHIAHHQHTKSEIPRTKIPVSKVLVHRASYRSLAGTTGKTATYHESAKK